jgi:uncharacterized membrane protein YhaH (DUF805 family)
MATVNPAANPASVNPYRAPAAAVADAADEYQPVNIYSASGRIGRARYIAYTLGLSILFGIFVAGVAGALGAMGSAGLAGIATIVIYLGLLVWMFMLTIQRAHDFNTTGWLSILMLIPLVNLLFWFIPGTDGENRFGGKTPPNSVLVLIAAWLVPILFIGGILAAIALPAYSDYVKRAQAKQLQKK